MASLLFQGSFATGLDETEAQSTVEPIRTDGSDASAASAPEWNTVESDDSGELVGLSPRVVAPKTENKEHFTPSTIGAYDPPREGIHALNDQVASSGTAAGREMAGQFGHGPILETDGIEPLNPAQRYGNDYFTVPDMGANELAGEYMQPPQGDNWVQQVAQAQANENARVAYRSTQYANFFGSK